VAASAHTVPVTRVLVCEDENVLRNALCDLIAGADGLELVGAAADVDEAIALARKVRPDVALVDVKMPCGGGERAAREICTEFPATRVVALSAYEDRASVISMMRAGAVGYLVKGMSANEILEAIGRAARGQVSLTAEMMSDVIEALSDDLVAHREADDLSRRSEEQIRGLLESAPDAVVMVDAGGQIALANQHAEELFGYHRKDLLGRKIELLLPERFRGRHIPHRDGYLADPRHRPMGVGLELLARHKNGTEFPVDISLSGIETDEGPLVTAFIRTAREIRSTPAEVRGQSEEGIAARPESRHPMEVDLDPAGRRELGSEDRLAALLEAAPDGIVITDEDGRIVLVNAETEKLFQYSRAELLGEPIEMLLPERFRGHHVAYRRGQVTVSVTRPEGADVELAGRRKDGSEFPVDISLSAIETGEGRLVTAFVRDISERLEQRLQRVLVERRALLGYLVGAGEEERQRIAANIHDDSIQAITAAGMRLQILRRTVTDPEQLMLLGELESTIQVSISRLRHLLFELRPPALDHEGLAVALRMYLDEWEAETQYRLYERLVSQPAEETRLILYRIAQEALTNVSKHAQATGVQVVLDERDGGYLVRITDDGVGFVPENAGPVPGHLGLASMRERAELAGGWLRVDSAPQAGTAVEFWIPAPPEAEALPA
jgi:PAS domain S-box-containing protein